MARIGETVRETEREIPLPSPAPEPAPGRGIRCPPEADSIGGGARRPSAADALR